jgi:hypothetical protein
MRFIKLSQGITITLAALLLSPTTTLAAVFSSAGSNPTSIQGTVDAFRAALGGNLNPNFVGSFADGRKEINWDGVPDRFSAPNNLPPDFFNVNSPRGAVFSTPGSGVQVSANLGVAPIKFDNINPTYSEQFSTFSPQRLFTAFALGLLFAAIFPLASWTKRPRSKSTV